MAEHVWLPMFTQTIPAGFPSPAADYMEPAIDLNTLLIRDPQATFLLRVQGDSMSPSGIVDGALVVVNAARTARSGDVVVAELDGEFTLKRLRTRAGYCELCPDNPSYPVIRIPEGGELRIFGVVTACITQLVSA